MLLGTSQNQLLRASLGNIVGATGCVLALVIAGPLVERRRLADFGLLWSAWEGARVAIGVVLGAALVGLIAVVLAAGGALSLRLQPWSTFAGASIGAAAGGFVVRYLFGSLFEELFARGYLLRTLAEVCRGSGLRPEHAVVLAAALTAVLFGVAHLANPDASARSALNLTLLGLVFSLPMVATGRLGLSVGLHAGWNIMQNTVLGLPNSGKASQVALFRTDVIGAAAWTGGPFGLEGGWATTVILFVVLGIGSAWLFRDPATRIAAQLADAPSARRAA